MYVTYDNFKEYGAYSNLYCYYPNNSNNIEIPKDTQTIMYVNTKSLNLNVRNTPGGAIVGSIVKGQQVTVYETKNGWSRIGNNQWVSSSYLATKNNNTPSSKYVLGKYVTNVRTSLNVRNAPVNGTILKTYKNGTRFDTYEIRNNWAKTPSGWVCLDFCTLIYKY